MKAYKVTTTFLGADRASAFYFSTKAAAELNLSKLDNGEITLVDIDADALPSEGCTYDDIAYHNPGHVWQNQDTGEEFTEAEIEELARQFYAEAGHETPEEYAEELKKKLELVR